MTFGSATDYTELQIVRCMVGATSAAIPASYHLRISTTPIADDGTGATEFSGSGYASQTVPGWDAVAPHALTVPRITARPNADITFPTPTATWWVASTTIYPYLTDEAGRVIWVWSMLSDVIDATHPLVFAHTTSPGQPNVEIGFTTQGVYQPFIADAVMTGVLTMLLGGAAWSVPSYEVALITAGIAGDPGSGEPSDGVAHAAPDPTYTRLPWPGWVEPFPNVEGPGRPSSWATDDLVWMINVDNANASSEQSWWNAVGVYLIPGSGNPPSDRHFAWGGNISHVPASAKLTLLKRALILEQH